MVVSERTGGREVREVVGLGGRSAGPRPPAGYLESLPVGPNDGDCVLPPRLLLQPPQLPASLHTQGGREETEETAENPSSRER